MTKDSLLALLPRPLWRGWLHLVAAPLVAGLSLVLVVLSPPAHRLPVLVYALTSVLLFSFSALYHRGQWAPHALALLRRVDHSNIALIIAGTYTPLAATVLRRHGGTPLLWLVWSLATLVIISRWVWTSAPRWVYVGAYIAMGWVAILYIPDIALHSSLSLLLFLLAGGVLYSLGGVVYALRRPDPSPRVFGFHEVFHSLTLGGWAMHFVVVALCLHV